MGSSRLLINEPPLQVLPTLAKKIGLNEAIVVQQLHYWIKTYERADSREHFREGRWWIYNSYDDWKLNNFPFWSTSTIRRIVDRLATSGIVIKRQFEQSVGDATNWYTIDYDCLESVAPQVRACAQNEQRGSAQNEQRGSAQNGQLSYTESRVYTENKTETPDGVIGSESNTETDDPPTDDDDRPLPWIRPDMYTVAEIKPQDLTLEQWTALKDHEQQNKKRKTVIEFCEARIRDLYRPYNWGDMIKAVADALGVSLRDPAISGKVSNLIKNQLWVGENPYSPDELVGFKAEQNRRDPKGGWQKWITFGNLPEKLSKYRLWAQGKDPVNGETDEERDARYKRHVGDDGVVDISKVGKGR